MKIESVKTAFSTFFYCSRKRQSKSNSIIYLYVYMSCYIFTIENSCLFAFLLDDPPCVSNPCQNGATCMNNVDNDNYVCLCPTNFAGTNCEEPVDGVECSSNPCQNGGTCVEGFRSFTCTCPTTWSSNLCDVDVNECLSFLQPCQNGGTCTNLIGYYRCSCPVGYAGENCETNINDCSPLPCLNGGACIDGINGYSCLCPDGYEVSLFGLIIPVACFRVS